MVVVKILKRRDASSVVVAVVVAIIVSGMLVAVTAHLAGWISGLSEGQYSNPASSTGWQEQYLYPVVQAALQLLALEVLGWLYVWVRGASK
jgi:hypothetical protein